MLALGITGLVGIQLGHFLHIDAYTLTVKKHKVHGFDGGGHSGNEVIGDGLQNELGRRLLREPIPVGENTVVSIWGSTMSPLRLPLQGPHSGLEFTEPWRCSCRSVRVLVGQVD